MHFAGAFHFISIFVLLSSFIALILTRLAVFNSWLALFLALAVTMVLWRRFDAPRILTSDSSVSGTWPRFTMALLLVSSTFCLSYSFPFYHMSGGVDEGNYFLQSVQIARKGELHLTLPILRSEEVQSLGRALEGDFPGIYSAREWGYSEDPAELIPQFNHLNSATRAVLASFAGIEGVWVSSSILAALAMGSFLLVAVWLLGAPLGFVAAFSFSLNAAFLWNSRTSLTEVFTLFAVMYGVLAASLAIKHGSLSMGALSGFGFGLAVFSRVDGTLVAFLVLGFVAAGMLRNPRPTASLKMLLAIFTSMFGLALLDLYLSSGPYLEELLHRERILPLFLGTATAVGASWVVIAFRSLLASRADGVLWSLRYIVGGGTCLLVLSFSYFYYIFPLKADPSSQGLRELFRFRATSELEWYITLPVFAMYFVGLLIASRRMRLTFMPIVVFSAMTLFVFMYKTAIFPLQPYASRRWLVFVIPFVILLALVPIRYLIAKEQEFVAISLLVVLGVIYAGAQWRLVHPWAFEPQLAEWREGYSQLAAELKRRNHRFFLTENTQIASILTFVHDVNVLLLRQDWRERLRPEESLVPVGGLPRICGTLLEQTQGWRPTRMLTNCLEPRIFVPATRAYSLGETIDFSEVGNSARYQRRGWSGAEPWGTWTDAKEASLVLDIESPLKGDLLLVADVQGFVPSESLNQTVIVLINGQQVAEWSFQPPMTSSRRQVHVSNRTAQSKQPLEIVFHMPDAVSPAKLGVSTDERVLGLGMISLLIEQAPSAD